MPAAVDPKRRKFCAVYDGRVQLGVFVLNERTNVAFAWDPERRFIGRVIGLKAAPEAISRNVQARISAAEARRRLNDPRPPFVSGLSGDFLGRPG